MTARNIQRRKAGWRQLATGLPVNAMILLLSSLPAFSQVCQPPPAGLASWWRAEGTTDDFIGGNAGVLVNGAGFASGKVGQAFSFNGTNSYVRVPGGPNLKFTGPFSIEAWVKYDRLTDPGGNGGCIVAKGIDQDAPLDWALDIDGGGHLTPLVNANGGWHYFSCNTVLSPHVWYHVAMVYDGAHLQGYVNGAFDGSAPVTGVVQASDNPLRIGIYATTGGGGTEGGGNLPTAAFAGSIDELSLYNRALAAAEIQAIYNAASAGKCATPAPPSVVTQPAGQTVYAGANVAFTLSAAGATPLSYQWQFNHTNINGATNTLLVLTNVLSSSNGNYSVLVSNFVNFTNSSNALLTVNPAPPCQPAPAGLVSWWSGDGNTEDLAGGNAGLLRGGATFAPGEVASAFAFDGTNNYVEVPAGDNLKFSGPFSAEAWINYDQLTGFGGGDILAKGPDQNSALDWAFTVSSGGKLRPHVNLPGGWTYFDCNTSLSPGVWYHVAMVYDGAHLQGFVNGALDGSVSATGAVQTSEGPLRIGAYAPVGAGPLAGSMFTGRIDELSLYNRALTAAEIQAIYNLSSVGKCKTPAPPSVVTQPVSRTVYVGANVSFAASAAGATPLSYQWQFNTTNINGATNTLLTLTNVPQSSNGNYRVFVTGPGGSTNSSNAVLTVNPAPPCQPAPAGIVSWWPGEGTADDLVGGNAGVLINGTGFAPGEAGSAFTFDGISNYVLVPRSANLKFAGPFSIETWVNFSLTGNPEAAVVAKGVDDLVPLDWALQIDGGGHLTPLVNANGWNYFACNTAMSPSVWYHVAMVYDGTNLQGYVNGVLDGSVPVSGAVQTSDTALKIGTYAAGTGYAMFAGRIDELSLYNRALTAGEIQAIYNLSSSGKCKTPAPPQVITQPSSQTVYAGANVFFSASATGATPLSYQWQFNTTNITGATNTLLVLTNLPQSSNGNYRVFVTGPGGSTNSSNALLTINPAPPCQTAPAGIVSWWPGEGTADDLVGGNAGVLVNGTSFAPGKAGGAFSFDGTNNYVLVPDSPNLEFAGPFSIEAWVNYTFIGSSQYSIMAKGIDQNLPLDWALDIDANGRLIPLVNANGWHYFTCNTAMSPGVWYHVAMVYDGTNLQGYVNGVLDGSVPVSGAVQTSANPLRIGSYAPSEGYAMFAGRIDELSLYNRALTVGEIQAIYNLSSVGKCKTPAPPLVITQPADQTILAGSNVTFSVATSGATPFTYQWQFNSTNIAGATNALFSLTNTPASSNGLYRVLVGNAVNSTTSSNALLTVQRLPPLFDTSPGSIHLTTNGLGLRLLDLSGHGPVIISASSNLVTWQPIFTNPPVLGTLQFLDPAATNFQARFYKADEQ